MQVCKKVMKQALPAKADYSDRSSAPDATHGVRRETEFKHPANVDEDVPPEMRVKAFKARLG